MKMMIAILTVCALLPFSALADSHLEETRGVMAQPHADVPAIESVIPDWGELGRMTEVVITGTGFVPASETSAATEVNLDGVEVVDVRVISPTEIRATIPARQRRGWAMLEVRNHDNQSANRHQGFHYGPIPQGLFDSISQQFAAFSERFSMGGITMYIILALSIFALGWFIHCLAHLRTDVLLPESFSNQISALVSKGDFGEAQKACERNRSLLSRVALAGIRRAGDPPQKIAEAIEASGSREAAHLHQKISYLSNVGVVTPMLGLFGTVLGMIMVFNQIADQQGAHQLTLAAGISKALYTTAFGLVVGIPAMCAYYYLRGKVVRLVTDLEEEAEELARAMSSRRS